MDFSSKTIVVTGASGLIGSNLVNRLLENYNCNVIAIGRNKGKLEKAFENYQGSINLRLIQHDVSDPLTLDENVDYIFHAAGPTAGKIIRETPVNVILPNILGTINILNFMEKQKEEKQANPKLVVFSSATVYGNIQKEDVLVKEEDTAIADALDAINSPYSESKRMVEVIAKSYAKQKGLEVKIIRFSYLYGYTKSLPNTAFYEFIKKALAGENITLNNAALPRRDNIYVQDAIDGLLTVAARGDVGESYNVSSNKAGHNFAAVDEMADIIAKVVNRRNGTKVKVLYRDTDSSNNRLPGTILSNDKLHALGWNINYSLEKGIEETIGLYIKSLQLGD